MRSHIGTPLRARALKLVLATALTLAFGALGGLGCASKKNLDANVDRLVKAAAKNDYADFKAISMPELAEQFPPEKLTELSQALALLGEYQERTMKGIHVKTGGVQEGRYVLRFAKGKVNLEIKLLKGKLTAFFFKGDDLQKAMRKARDARYADFKLTGFQWTDAQGKPTSNIYALGTPVHFRVQVWGLKLENKSFNLMAALQVISGDKVVLDQPRFVDRALPLPEGQPPMASLTGNLNIPQAGNYKLSLKVTNKATQKVVTHEEAFVVEPAK